MKGIILAEGSGKRFYLAVFLAVFVFLVFLGIVCIKGNEVLDVQGIYEEADIYQYIVHISGYSIDDFGDFHVENTDPQIYLDFTKLNTNKVYGIKLELDNEIELSSVQLYYGRDSLDFMEEDSKRFISGKDKIVEQISLSGFNYIRLDINEDFRVADFQIAYDFNTSKVTSKSAYLFMLIINLIISVILAFFCSLNDVLKKIYLYICKVIKYVKKNWKEVLKTVLLISILFILSIGAEKSLDLIRGKEYINKYRLIIMFCILTTMCCSIKYYKIIGKYMHIYFFILTMFIGTVHVIAAPPAPGISWDDEIHYGRTSYLSRGAIGYISDSDSKAINRYVETITTKDVYSYTGRSEWVKNVTKNSAEDKFLVETDNYSLNHIYIAYIPAAFGLNLGRCLGLNFTHTFMLGKWMNILTYSLIFSYSIKLLKTRGKILVAFIGLIPTSLFVATSYSYDWWVISLCVLGYSLFINGMQSEKKITTKRFLAIMLIMIAGILPKAVYFVLILPMMFLRKEKYEKPKLCRLLAVIAMLILIASFIFPIFFGGGFGSGDSRGGSDVNATEQVEFILKHPIEYSKILIGFLQDYLSLDRAYGYLTYLAYYGQAKYYTICILLLGIAAVLDNNEIIKNKKNMLIKLIVCISAAMSIVLVATALYIDFTPLQHVTILGCQPRYLLPFIFPVCYFISELDLMVSEKIKTNLYIIGSNIMSFIFLYGIYLRCIRYY